MSYFVLLTGFAILAAGFCGYFCWQAGLAAEKAAHSEHRLSIMRGQVKGLEVAVVALDEQHKKLAGRVYADEYWRGKRDEQPDLQPHAAAGIDHVECGNWAIAQREGPLSEAARCECSYCEAKRADRAARRAKLRGGVKS